MICLFCGALCNVGLEERSINKGYYYRAETQSKQCQSDCGVRGQTVKMVVSLCLFPDLPAWLPISQRVGWPPYTCSSLPVCPSSTRLSQHPSTYLSISLSLSHFKLAVKSNQSCTERDVVVVEMLAADNETKDFLKGSRDGASQRERDPEGGGCHIECPDPMGSQAGD